MPLGQKPFRAGRALRALKAISFFRRDELIGECVLESERSSHVSIMIVIAFFLLATITS